MFKLLHSCLLASNWISVLSLSLSLLHAAKSSSPNKDLLSIALGDDVWCFPPVPAHSSTLDLLGELKVHGKPLDYLATTVHRAQQLSCGRERGGKMISLQAHCKLLVITFKPWFGARLFKGPLLPMQKCLAIKTFSRRASSCLIHLWKTTGSDFWEDKHDGFCLQRPILLPHCVPLGRFAKCESLALEICVAKTFCGCCFTFNQCCHYHLIGF